MADATKGVTYSVEVEPAWKARCVSPINGEMIEVYGDSHGEVRQKVDMELVKQAHTAGLTVAGRFDPAKR